MTCATFYLDNHGYHDNDKAPGHIREHLGKPVQATASDGRHWHGKLAAYYEGPVIVLESSLGMNVRVIPADAELDEPLLPEKVTCWQCKGTGKSFPLTGF